jgi:hypothetical protein
VGVVGRILIVVLVVGLIGAGCGDGGNDNGISFRAVGVFQGEFNQGQCEVPVADDAIADQSIELPLDSALLDGGFPTNIFFCRGFIWLENNLTEQAIVVDRFDFEYEIPGARIGIPPHSSPTGIRINANNLDPDGNPETPPPPNPFGPPNVYIGQPDAQIVPASLVLFLRQNRQVLPQLPYPMIIRIKALGRTDAGEHLTSNEIRYTIQFTPGIE